MSIYLYRNYTEWENDEAFEVLEGKLSFTRRGLVVIETVEDEKNYKQILSFDRIFAIVYKLPYGYLGYAKEINVFKDEYSWSNSEPDASFQGEIKEDESSDRYVSFDTADGYKQIISLSKVFAVTYEG